MARYKHYLKVRRHTQSPQKPQPETGMIIFTILMPDSNVKIFKTIKTCIDFMQSKGAVYVSGSRKMIKTTSADLEWEIENGHQCVFHTNSVIENYYYKIQKHEI